MLRVLLDTDILSEYLKGHNLTVVKHGSLYAASHTRFTFTSVTVYEIVFGLSAKGATRQVQEALRWMRNHEQVLPLEADYLTAAEVKATARKQGDTVELPDCLIAAVACRLDIPLVTGNAVDFKAIQNAGLPLKTTNWRDE